MKKGDLHRITIKPLPTEQRFRFDLEIHGRAQSVSFETTYQIAMSLMTALQEFQAKHKIPVPRNRPKTRSLKLVKPVDE